MNKKWLWLVAFIVVLLASFWFFWLRHYQDRQKFERIEETVAELTQRIQDKFSVAIVEERKFCQRESRKFESGPLNCYSSRVIDPGSNSVDGVYDHFGSQSDVMEKTIFDRRFDLSSTSGTCFISDNPPNILFPSRYLSAPYAGDSNTLIYFECSDRATKSHYEFIE